MEVTFAVGDKLVIRLSPSNTMLQITVTTNYLPHSREYSTEWRILSILSTNMSLATSSIRAIRDVLKQEEIKDYYD